MPRPARLFLLLATALTAPAVAPAQTPAAAPPSDAATRAAVRRARTPAKAPAVAPAPSSAAARRTAARTAARFVLTSADLAPGGRVGERHVFNGFGCSGQNVSPALAWRGAPADTRSFAVTVYDPDAPTGSGWWHWVVYNIPAATTALPAGAGAGAGMPAGAAQGTTDFGSSGYGGPCPPPGDRPHRYVFTVHALKVERLELPANATAAFVGFNLNANRLASASFTARYGR
jgi:Raf kinase inhibitor-like YbhB/YbcL family protein